MNECLIVKDLLPMYIENLVCKETSEMIEKHLKQCEDCNREFELQKVNINISLNNNKKKSVKSLNKTIILHYILSLTFIAGLTYAINIFQIYVPLPPVFLICTISLFGCGFVAQNLIKNIYITSTIPILCTYISITNETNMLSLKTISILILTNLFYILSGYTIAHMIYIKKVKAIPLTLVLIIGCFTSIPTKKYFNLWEKLWLKSVFRDHCKSYNSELIDFTYINGYNYVGYMNNATGEKYRLVAFNGNIGFPLKVEYEHTNYSYNSKDSDLLTDILVYNGLKFSEWNSPYVSVKSNEKVTMTNPYTNIDDIQRIQKYSIFLEHDNNIEINLQLNLNKYKEEIKDMDSFVSVVYNIIQTLNKLNLYYETMEIYFSDEMYYDESLKSYVSNTYKINLLKEQLKNIDIDTIKNLTSYYMDKYHKR